MPDENKVIISGHFPKVPEMKSIPTVNGALELCEGNLQYSAQRGEIEKDMWVDVEAFQDLAYELADVPANMAVRVTGELIRAAWKSKKTDEWVSKHVIRAKKIELLGEPNVQPESEIPF